MITDYFDKALYINLNNRTDRKLLSEIEFNKHGLTVERVEAITCPENRGDVISGHVGCILSHMKCIQRAKDNGWRNVLIFEDDVCLRDGCNELFDDYITRVPDSWMLLYLGGNHWGNCLQFKDGSKQVEIADNVFRTYNTLTTHAYAIHENIYDYLLNLLNKSQQEVDMAYVVAQQQCEAYCLRPNLAWQRAGWSDINRQECDYNFMIE